MQILHLKTRIKRENSILTGHLTAVKVGVIYCSGGVTAVYCTTQLHPPVGELSVLHRMQCVISVSSNWCLYLVAIWPSCAVTIPPIYSSQLSAAWSPPELWPDWEPAVLPRSPNTGWRSLVEAGVGSRQPGVRAVVRPGHLPRTRGHHTTASTPPPLPSSGVAVWL